jgi:hypothetical protein
VSLRQSLFFRDKDFVVAVEDASDDTDDSCEWPEYRNDAKQENDNAGSIFKIVSGDVFRLTIDEAEANSNYQNAEQVCE